MSRRESTRPGGRTVGRAWTFAANPDDLRRAYLDGYADAMCDGIESAAGPTSADPYQPRPTLADEEPATIRPTTRRCCRPRPTAN